MTRNVAGNKHRQNIVGKIVQARARLSGPCIILWHSLGIYVSTYMHRRVEQPRARITSRGCSRFLFTRIQHRFAAEHSAEWFSLVIYFGEQANNTSARNTNSWGVPSAVPVLCPLIRCVRASLEVNVATTLPPVHTHIYIYIYDVSPCTEKMRKFNDRTRDSFIKSTGTGVLLTFTVRVVTFFPCRISI